MSGDPHDETKRLRDSEEKYRKLFEKANDAVFVIDVSSGDVLEANPKAQEMTGYSADELGGMKVWCLHPPEEETVARDFFKQVGSSGVGIVKELNFLRKDATRLIVDVSASVIEIGGEKRIIRICRDVTARRGLERKNEYLRKHYEQILDMMPVGLGVKKNINTKPVVDFENKKLLELFHAGQDDEFHCLWHHSKIHPDILAKPFLVSNGTYAEEYTFPDQSVYQCTSNYFIDDEGVWCELQVVQDITNRKKLERELTSINEELESKVDERTRELRQKQVQLVQSEKMAALGHLVAGVAHEINTPLGAMVSNNDVFIRSMLRLKEMLLSGCLGDIERNPAILELLTGIEELTGVSKTAAERIIKIVTGLRKFARLEEAEIDTVDIHEGIDSTIILVQHETRNRIAIHREYGKLPAVTCHPNQLNQVFMNILVNAAHAIEDRGDIFIATKHINDAVVIEIRDTGKGIPPGSLEKIFDPGFTTKGMGVGTGLGLSIVYQIIKDHNGTIDVESAPGRGSTFRITLPVKSISPS
jgi:PAS domain S-box-containing protein